jgi:hypothetical protein
MARPQNLGEFVRQCDICQHAKHQAPEHTSSWFIGTSTSTHWRDILMDFIEGLPLLEGYNVITVVVDRFTMYAHFVPLKHP